MSVESIRILLLPNKDHPYGDHLQDSLEKSGVIPLKCDAGWGFELHKNLQVTYDLNPDILHLQWPESLCRVEEGDDLGVLEKRIGEALSDVSQRGIPIVWTMHNLRPHHIFDSQFQTKMYEHFVAHADGVIHHSHWGMGEALQTYSYPTKTRHIVLRHGYFTKGTECHLTAKEAREKLGLPEERIIYLFCGAFRRDKNIDTLVRAFGDNSPDAPYLLVMVGQEKEAASALHPDCDLDFLNIVWPGRLPFEDLSIYVRASDALVSAHGDRHLTSAGPHLSQAYLKSQVCLLSDYNTEVLGDSAFYFAGGDDAAHNLRNLVAGVTRDMLHDASDRLEQQRQNYHWDVIGRETRSFYEDVLSAE